MGLLRTTILCLIVVGAFAAGGNCGCKIENVNSGGQIANFHTSEGGTVHVEPIGDKNEESDKVLSDESEFHDGAEFESNATQALEDRLVKGLVHYSKTGQVTEQLNKDLEKVQIFKRLPEEEPFRKFASFSQIKAITFCKVCSIAAKILLTIRPLGKEFVGRGIKLLCYQIESTNVCDGLIDLNIDIFLYIVDKKPDINTEKICSIIGQSFNCKDTNSGDLWSVYVPPKARSSRNPKFIAEQKSDAYEKPLRILHITDIHYDYKYIAGGNTQCGEPLCCGYDQGKPRRPKDAAGVWGDYRSCDMPLYAVENLMDAAAQHDVDFIYHTGDIINHRVWQTARATNSKSILEVNELFRTKFPNKTVYHIAGNHEPNPLNEFAPEQITEDDFSTHWLYDLLAKEWATWLPEETLPTIRKGGYYTVSVRPGFRIIALNSNVCYVYNWWLLYNDVDPYGQLQWLSDTLYQAELDGEVVHILTHVPSGDKACYKKWSHEYNRIVRRFASTIKAQFVGHTHFNELHFFYEENKEDPINVAFNGGSFTTFIDVNPNYRIYEVHPNTYQVDDYEDWIYNITEANQHGRSVPPRWYKLYNFKEAYGLQSMDLPELGKFVRTLSTNTTTLNTYYRLKVRDGDASIIKGCDDECNTEQLCNLVTSEHGSTQQCEKILLAYTQASEISHN